MQNFGVTASKLARNPLGILALMIVLVYGIAGLVTGAQSLEPTERLILIIFLVAFPLVVLIALYLLVTRHHDKLYAPTDFANEDNFVRLIEKGLQQSPKFKEVENKADEAMQEAQIMSIKASEDETDELETDDVEILEKAAGAPMPGKDLSNEEKVLLEVRNSRFTYRSVFGIKKGTGFTYRELNEILEKLVIERLLGKRDRGSGMKYYITDNGLEKLRKAGI